MLSGLWENERPWEVNWVLALTASWEGALCWSLAAHTLPELGRGEERQAPFHSQS